MDLQIVLAPSLSPVHQSTILVDTPIQTTCLIPSLWYHTSQTAHQTFILIALCSCSLSSCMFAHPHRGELLFTHSLFSPVLTVGSQYLCSSHSSLAFHPHPLTWTLCHLHLLPSPFTAHSACYRVTATGRTHGGTSSIGVGAFNSFVVIHWLCIQF